MLVELSILPLVGDGHLSDELAEVLKLIDSYGLPYQLTPTATHRRRLERGHGACAPVSQLC